ncbi:thioredoxin-like protein [Bombardia bombarda]|uniref:Glutathione S-transferase kappa 1 n=1 Tax=Bombardia bombarda TaxID=252184 RepID=A0AA39WTA4_9PEZI|nr:thioredoxin-like protein [Bombardia bombarda]
MGGRIDCYLDIVSFYSYLAFLDLLKNRDLLKSYAIEVDFRPVLLGAINVGSGNKPPWTLPAKAHYGKYDAQRALARFPGLALSFPADLMAVSMTATPNRALHYIKRNFPPQTFHTALHHLLYTFWSPPNVNLSRPENVAKALSEVSVGFDGNSSKGTPLFTAQEVQTIMQAASSAEYKDLLKATTQEALERGAFGAPWLWVTNEAGVAEPFFGSDRFHFVYKFLGLPFQEVMLLPASSSEQTGASSAGAGGGKPKL